MSSLSIPIPPRPSRLSLFLPFLIALSAVGVVLLLTYSPIAVAVIAGVVIFFFSAVENETALLVNIFLLPAAWILRVDSPISNIVVPARDLAVLGFFLGRLCRGNLRLRELLKPRISRLSLGFLAAAVASVAFGSAGWTHGSLRGLFLVGSYIAFYFFILAWVNSPERLGKVIRVLLWSTIAVGMFGILQEMMDGYTSFWLALYSPDESFSPWNGRITSFLSQPNVLAGYLNLVLPVALACCFLTTHENKRLFRWTFAISAVALALTQSRGALIGFACTLLIGIVCFVKRRQTRVFAIVAFALLGAVFYFGARVLSPLHFAEMNQEPLERLAFWSTSLRLFAESPIFGAGIGSFSELYGRYIPHFLIPPRVFTANGLYFQLLGEMGLLGLASFLSLSLFAVREAACRFRQSSDFFFRAVAFGVSCGVLANLVHGFVDLALDVSPQWSSLLWLMLALLAAGTKVSASLGHISNTATFDAA